MWEEKIKALLKHIKLYELGKYPADKLNKELTSFFYEVDDRICEILKKNGSLCYRDYLKEYTPMRAEALVREDIENWKNLGVVGEIFAKLLSLSLTFPQIRNMSLHDKIIFFDKILRVESTAQKLKEFLVGQETLFGVNINKIVEEVNAEINEDFDTERISQLKERIVRFIKKNSREGRLSINTIKKHFSESYSPAEIEKAISELVESGRAKVRKVGTIFGVSEYLELIEPKVTLKTFAEEEVTLTPSEKRDLEAVKKAFNVKEPEIVEVDGTKTVIVEYEGEKLNVAIGEIKNPEMFEPLSVAGRVFHVKKSTALERVKKKLRERPVEVERPKARIEEYGALGKFEKPKYSKHKEAIEILKRVAEED